MMWRKFSLIAEMFFGKMSIKKNGRRICRPFLVVVYAQALVAACGS